MIAKSVRLPLEAGAAFALFTNRVDDWWPRQRRHSDDPDAQIQLDRGGLRERNPDGSLVALGRIIVWDPPALISLDFYPGTDVDHPTRLIVTFVPDGQATVVTVHHRPTDASAALWESRAPAYEESWDLLLPALVAAAQA